MLKKIISVLILSFFSLLFPKTILAEGEFSTSYNLVYEVIESGETVVTEDITLKNLTDRFYAASFNLSIGATKLSEVSASDTQGPLETQVAQKGNKTDVNVKFASQVIGEGKEYKWKLRFKSADFAERQGKVWQVTIPKISSTPNIDQLELRLSVPVKFGEPTSITPKPSRELESAGKVNFIFQKDQLLGNGIFATFGTEQLFSFNLKYRLINNNFIIASGSIPIPPQTPFQDVIIENIKPIPQNVFFDSDGNQIAHFKVEPKITQEITITGFVRIRTSPSKSTLNKDSLSILTSSQKYWEADNPVILTKLKEILEKSNPKESSTKEKARLINQFVVDNLSYNQERIKEDDFKRLGALTALNNPELALCSEFTDLFITLARAAKIPARQLVGFAYTSNTDLRPLSLKDNVFHAWPEYFDGEDWVMIDPTWQNTTGGVDYFNKFDLNHFVLAIRGVSSEEPVPADEAKVEFSDISFTPKSKLSIRFEGHDQIIAGIPGKIKIVVENSGSISYPTANMIISTSKILIRNEKNVTTPTIPPFGHFEYEIDMRTGAPWNSYEDILQVSVGDQSVSKKITVKPIFALRIFPFAIISLVLAMLAIYITSVKLNRTRI